MTLDTGWLALGALLLFVAWLGWTALRRRPPPVVEENATEVVSPPEVVAAAADPAPVVVVPPPPPPAPPPPATPAPAPAPFVQATTEPTPIARPAVRPPPPRFERVLGLEAAEPSLWGAAEPVPLSPMHADAVAAALTALDATRRGEADVDTVVAVAFPAGSMLRIARADTEIMKSLAAEHEGATSRVLGWLDSKAASSLAASLLAGLASARHLDALHGEVQAIKAGVAALPPKLAQADGGLKTLVQDLSRYLREARDNYAALVAKAAFRERIDESCARMLALWREVDARLADRRRALTTLAAAPRFGEAQVERSLAELRELREQRRLQLLNGRVLAALHVLRASLGGAVAPGVEQPLRAAAASLRSAAAEERGLAGRLRASERSAQGDPYVGKAEFEANRAALRKLIEGLGITAEPEGLDRLENASAVAIEGFPDGAGGDERWLVRLGASPVAADVRRARVTRLH